MVQKKKKLLDTKAKLPAYLFHRRTLGTPVPGIRNCYDGVRRSLTVFQRSEGKEAEAWD